MGGNLRVVFRDTDDSLMVMERWTNSFPTFVNSLKFVTKSRKHLEEYLSSWKSMKKDWEDVRDHVYDTYKYGMTPVYAPFDASLPIAMSEYGIVVLDWKNDIIVSCNSYSTPGQKGAVFLSFKGFVDDAKDIRAFFQAGRIIGVTFVDGITRSLKKLKVKEFKDLRKVCQQKEAFHIVFDMSPFRIFAYKESERKDAFEKLKELGYPVKAKDWAKQR